MVRVVAAVEVAAVVVVIAVMVVAMGNDGGSGVGGS